MPIDFTAGVLTLALCARIQRTDGKVFRFTSNNEELLFNGEVYSPNDAIDTTAVRQSLESGSDNLNVTGILSSTQVTETDLRAGLFDHAVIRLFFLDWSNLIAGEQKLFKGWIGNISLQEGQYTAEIVSLSQRLQQQIGELTSPTCTVKQLGDERCKVNLALYQFTRSVSIVTNERNITFGADAHETGYYTYGRVIFTSGANNGITREIKSHTLSGGTAALILQEAFPFDVKIGDTATLEAGCDRTLTSCNLKFANVINFRGFPSVPGNDALLRRGQGAG